MAIQLNGHMLTGKKHRGRWKFECPSMPDLVEKYQHDRDSSKMIVEFQRRALIGGVTCRSNRE